MTEERFCKKCEIYRKFGESLEVYLRRYLEELPENNHVSDQEYEKRLAVCKDCQLFLQIPENGMAAMCRGCGCYVGLRAAVKQQRCPYEKWKAEKEDD